MNNTQVAAFIQNILMVVGSSMIGIKMGTNTVSPVDVQTVLGGLFTAIGFGWNHFAALSKS